MNYWVSWAKRPKPAQKTSASVRPVGLWPTEAMNAECEGIPMKRFGKPEEIAALAISLASTAGAYMTGSIISLDGGSSLTGG